MLKDKFVSCLELEVMIEYDRLQLNDENVLPLTPWWYTRHCNVNQFSGQEYIAVATVTS